MPKTHPDFPLAAEKPSRHGKIRWRFTRGNRPLLPGEPHSPEFVAAYTALCEGRNPKPSATVVEIRPQGIQPRSLWDAWERLKREPEWQANKANTRKAYEDCIERMLDTKVEGTDRLFRHGPLAELKRTHCIQLLNLWADSPWMAVVAKVCLKKLLMIGIDADPQWMQHSPMEGLKLGLQPKDRDGFNAWKQEHLDAYWARWPQGSPQRVAAALGLWLGDRVSDVVSLDWSMLTTVEVMIDGELVSVEGFDFAQFKGRSTKRGETMFLPMLPMLADELKGQERTGPVLKKERGQGGYDVKSVSNMMSKKWSRQAGLPVGYSMHGLRKALATKMAMADATTREIMMFCGWRDIAYVELYTRKADQARMAVTAGLKLSRYEDLRKKARVKERRAKLKLVS